jgi:hypothetical protein
MRTIGLALMVPLALFLGPACDKKEAPAREQAPAANTGEPTAAPAPAQTARNPPIPRALKAARQPNLAHRPASTPPPTSTATARRMAGRLRRPTPATSSYARLAMGPSMSGCSMEASA